MRRSICLLALFAVACAEPARPVAPWFVPPPVPAPAPPVLPVAPPLTQLHEAWVHACELVGGKNLNCGLEALDVAPDGAFVVGGGTYAAVEFGGARHPQRAYQQLLLASFDAAGRPLWSKAWGTQWHNNVSDVRFVGEGIIITGVHANGFSAGDKRIPDLKYRYVPGQDTAFEAETGFVAAVGRDGKVLWAMNSSELLGAGASVGLSYGNRSIFPDSGQGFWLPYTAADQLMHVARVVGGKVVEQRAQALPKLNPIPGMAAQVDRDGRILMVASPPWTPQSKGSSINLFRFDMRGQMRTTLLSEIPAPGPRDDPRQWPMTQTGAILQLADDGSAIVALDVEGHFTQERKSFARLIRVDASGAVVFDRPLFEAVGAARNGPDPASVRAMHVSNDGTVRVLLNHRVPIVADGTRVDPIPLPALLTDPPGTATLVTLAGQGTTMQSVATLAPSWCIQHSPSSTRWMIPVDRGVLVLTGPRLSAPVPGCGGTHKRDGMIVRLE